MTEPLTTITSDEVEETVPLPLRDALAQYHFNVVEAIGNTKVLLTIVPKELDGTSWRVCLELGAAILQDIPIIALVMNEREVPEGLRKVAARVVEADNLREALEEVLG